MDEMEVSFQTNSEGYVDESDASENSPIMQHTDHPQQINTHVKFTRQPWVRCAQLSGICKTYSPWRLQHSGGEVQDVP